MSDGATSHAPLPGGAIGFDDARRLDILDGLRGVGALLVVVFHAFGRWAEPNHPTTLYPHGNALTVLPVLDLFGLIGIHLFFLISGFVIMMTLERSRGVVDFAGRRIARLWPAMIVCATLSTLVIAVSDIPTYYNMERWSVRPVEYLSSILFVPPDLLGGALGIEGQLNWVEGAYWTLWHEVRFYALVALVFFAAPKAWFLGLWAGLQALSTGLELWGATEPGREYAFGLLSVLVLQPRMLGWFSLGLCAYMLWTRRAGPTVIAIAVLAAIAIVAQEVVVVRDGGLVLADDVTWWLLHYTMVLTPFALFLLRSSILAPLGWRPAVLIGLASYSLYLFHELPMMALMMAGAEAGLPALPVVFGAIGLVIGVAIVIHYGVERPGKRVVLRFWQRMFGDADQLGGGRSVKGL